MIAAGLRFGRGEIKRLVGSAMPNDLMFNIGAGQLIFTSDTADDVNFPSDGHIVRVNLDFSTGALGADDDYTKLEVAANQAFEIGRTRVIFGLNGGTALSGDLPIYDRLSAGGMFSMSGYARGEITGSNMLMGRLIVLQPLTESSPMAFNLQLYLGGSLELGATDDGTGEGLDRRHYGGSAFLGADTPLGPAYLGFGVGDGGRRAGYLYFGKLF